MKLPTPDCPWCARRVEDRGDHFLCQHHGRHHSVPAEWYLRLAGEFGENAALAVALDSSPRDAYIEARWAARAAMRAVPELRG